MCNGIKTTVETPLERQHFVSNEITNDVTTEELCTGNTQDDDVQCTVPCVHMCVCVSV